MSDRVIKIKSGIVKRIFKELKGYEVEAKKQQAKIEKMELDGVDIHDIRKQKEVLEETLQMLPDCEKRFTAAYQELVKLLTDTEESAEVKIAREIISECVV